MFWTLLILFFVPARGNLQCGWACDDPLCEPICVAKCQPSVCIYLCNETISCNREPECFTFCLASNSSLVSETCPMCETRCEDPDCDCLIQCEEPQCGWECTKPRTCRYPLCELQCEQPACEYESNAGRLSLFW